jgi:hypothetical protein
VTATLTHLPALTARPQCPLLKCCQVCGRYIRFVGTFFVVFMVVGDRIVNNIRQLKLIPPNHPPPQLLLGTTRQIIMLKVKQDQLAHATNIAYINVRNNELNYFQSFFGGFGVQIALIAAFNLNVISQTVCKCPCSSACIHSN